ncbi:fimbrial biogenesis chaperone [Serratia fonticola]
MNEHRLNGLALTSRFLRISAMILCVLLGNAALAANGGVQLNQTRVIFDGKAQNAKATIKNQSDRVYLIKAGVLATPDQNATQKSAIVPAVPFMVTPPLFRLEPNSQNSVLIVRDGTAELPTDRESVFYLSLMAIPSTSKLTEDHNGGVSALVSVGIQTIIKLFYRPEGLSIPVQAAAEKLTFRQVGPVLQIANPTPYFVTLARLTLNGKVMDVRDTKAGAMIAPFSTQDYPITGQVHQITWTAINDYGGRSAEYHTTASSIKAAL